MKDFVKQIVEHPAYFADMVPRSFWLCGYEYMLNIEIKPLENTVVLRYKEEDTNNAIIDIVLDMNDDVLNNSKDMALLLNAAVKGVCDDAVEQAQPLTE